MGGPHMARMARRLAGDVTIYTDGNEELAEQLRKTLENDQNISIDNRQIRRLTKGAKAAEVDITFADGETVTEGFIVSTHFGI